MLEHANLERLAGLLSQGQRCLERLDSLERYQRHQLEMGRTLAGFYSDLWNALALQGRMPSDSELTIIDSELQGSGWRLDWQGRRRGWVVVPLRYEHQGLLLRYAAERAPAGGITLGGRTFKGGQWIPSSAVADAPEEDRKRLAEAQGKEKEGQAQRSRQRLARGSVDREGLKKRLEAGASGLGARSQAEEAEDKRAGVSLWTALSRHHGKLALHRLEELAHQLETALKGIPEGEEHEGLRQNLKRQTLRLQGALGRAEQAGHTGQVDEAEAQSARATLEPVKEVMSEPGTPAEPETGPSQIDQRELAQHAVFALRDTMNPESRAVIEQALENAGMSRVGKAGEVVQFTARLHDCDDPVFPGDPVRVIRSGFALVSESSRYLFSRAKVEAADLLPKDASRVPETPINPGRARMSVEQSLMEAWRKIHDQGGRDALRRAMLNAGMAAPAPENPPLDADGLRGALKNSMLAQRDGQGFVGSLLWNLQSNFFTMSREEAESVIQGLQDAGLVELHPPGPRDTGKEVARESVGGMFRLTLPRGVDEQAIQDFVSSWEKGETDPETSQGTELADVKEAVASATGQVPAGSVTAESATPTQAVSEAPATETLPSEQPDAAPAAEYTNREVAGLVRQGKKPEGLSQEEQDRLLAWHYRQLGFESKAEALRAGTLEDREGELRRAWGTAEGFYGEDAADPQTGARPVRPEPATATVPESPPAATEASKEDSTAAESIFGRVDRTPKPAVARAPGVSLEDIPYRSAYNAHRNTSHVPEVRAKHRQNEYVEQMNADWDYLAGLAKTPEQQEQLKAEFDRYRQGYRDRTLAWLGAAANTASPMITGPAKFPTERNRKRLETEHRRITELIDFRKRALAAIRKKLVPEESGIKSSDPGAVDALTKKLEGLRQQQELFKKVNAAHRAFLKDPASLDASDLPDAWKQNIRTYKPAYSWEPHPIAPYQLTNLGAQIRSVEQRIKDVSAMQAGPHKEEKYTGGVKVVEDPEAGRIRIHFPGKPDKATIDLLKSRGFRWSPSEGAWQRHLNAAGRIQVESVLKAKGHTKETPPAATPATEEEVPPLLVMPEPEPDLEDKP